MYQPYLTFQILFSYWKEYRQILQYNFPLKILITLIDELRKSGHLVEKVKNFSVAELPIFATYTEKNAFSFLRITYGYLFFVKLKIDSE